MFCIAKKVISFLLCLALVFEQSAAAQIAQVDLSGIISQPTTLASGDKFRPLHLRALSYDTGNENFRLLLDKGDALSPSWNFLEETNNKIYGYFLTGVTLPNDTFWVNLRPGREDNMIDPEMEKTDAGRILLEADVQLKKDTARYTSPETPEGREYWNKLYAKAEQLYGSTPEKIPTTVRPWIVPNEIVFRETKDSAYIYKATLKVMLEEDYLQTADHRTGLDEREKILNEYAAQLMRRLVIPKINRDINSSRRYAPLRQVYYSLIMAQWFKSRFAGKAGSYCELIDSKDLSGLTSKERWSKNEYFREYEKSFEEGEYSVKETVNTISGPAVRTYVSGGLSLNITEKIPPIDPAAQPGDTAKLPNSPVIVKTGNPYIPVPANDLMLFTPDNKPGGQRETPGPIKTTTISQTINFLISASGNKEKKLDALSSLGRTLCFGTNTTLLFESYLPRLKDLILSPAENMLVRLKTAELLEIMRLSGNKKAASVSEDIIRSLSNNPNPDASGWIAALNDTLKGKNKRISIILSRVYHIRAAKSFIAAMGWDPKRVVIETSMYVSQELVKEEFPGYNVFPLEKNRTEIPTIFFTAEQSVILTPNLFEIYHSPFIYDIPRLPEERSAKIRKELTGGRDRKIIVAGSPTSADAQKIITVYNELYGDLPASERPLLILAPNGDRDLDFIKKLPGIPGADNILVERRKNERGSAFSDMTGKNILLVDTRGELLSLYAAADVCMVGYGHNLFEPISQGRGVLYFQHADAYPHQEDLNVLAGNGAALEFCKNNLVLLMSNRDFSANMNSKAGSLGKDLKDTRIKEAAQKYAQTILLGLLMQESNASRSGETLSSTQTRVIVLRLKEFLTKNNIPANDMLGLIQLAAKVYECRRFPEDIAAYLQSLPDTDPFKSLKEEAIPLLIQTVQDAASQSRIGFTGTGMFPTEANEDILAGSAEKAIAAYETLSLFQIKEHRIVLDRTVMHIEEMTVRLVSDSEQEEFIKCEEDGKVISVNENKINSYLDKKGVLDDKLTKAVFDRMLIHDVAEAVAIQSGIRQEEAHAAGLLAEAMHPSNSSEQRTILRDLLKERDIRQRGYTDMILSAPVSDSEDLESAAEPAKSPDKERRDSNLHEKYERILRHAKKSSEIFDILKKRPGDTITENEINDLINILESHNPLGHIQRLSQGDTVLLFEVPGRGKSGGFGMKELNDEILGFNLTSRLIGIRRAFLIETLKENGLADENCLLYSTYKEDAFLLKKPLDADTLERLCETVRAKISRRMREDETFKKTLEANGVDTTDENKPLYEVYYGMAGVEENTDLSRVTAIINARQHITIKHTTRDSTAFSFADYENLIKTISSLRAELKDNGILDHQEGPEGYYLKDEIAAVLRKRVSWEKLSPKEQSLLKDMPTHQMASLYFDLLHIQDNMKGWELDIEAARQRALEIEDVISALREIKNNLVRNQTEQGIVLSEKEIPILAEAKYYIETETKLPAFSSLFAFHARAPPMDNPTYITLDVKGMGLMNTKAFELELQEIERIITESGATPDKEKVRRLWMSAADSVTKRLFENNALVLEIIGKHLGLEGSELKEKTAVLVGGDELTIAVDKSMDTASLYALLQEIRGKTGMRAAATQATHEFRKQFINRSDIDPAYLGHAHALISMEEGIDKLKILEKKGGGEEVAIQDNEGNWYIFPENQHLRQYAYSAAKTTILVSGTNKTYFKSSAGAISLGLSMNHLLLFTEKGDFPEIILAPEGNWTGENGENMMQLCSAIETNFIEHNRKTKIVCQPDQKERIIQYLMLTNPYYLPNATGYSEDLIARFRREAVYLADREEINGRRQMVFPHSDMVEFIELSSNGETTINGVTIKTASGGYIIDDPVLGTRKNLDAENLTAPALEFNPAVALREKPEFGVTFLGTSSGRDKYGLPSNQIIWAGKQSVLVDLNAATLAGIFSLRLSPKDISHILITHMHEDHTAGTLEYMEWCKRNNHPIRLIMEPGIYELFKLQAKQTLNRDIDQVYTIEFIPLRFYETRELKENADILKIDSAPGFHGTPSTMLRFTYHGHTISVSGDTAYDPVRFAKIINDELPEDIRKDLLAHTEGEENLPVMDNGRAQELSEFLFKPNDNGLIPEIIIHESGSKSNYEENNSNHTSPFALQHLPEEIQRVILINHASAVPENISLKQAIPFSTIKVNFQKPGSGANHSSVAFDRSSANNGEEITNVPKDTDKGGIDLMSLKPLSLRQPAQSQHSVFGKRDKSADLSTGIFNRNGSEKEWERIRNMVESGIMPSLDGLEKLARGSCYPEMPADARDQIFSCVIGIMRLAERGTDLTPQQLYETMSLIEQLP